MARRTPGEILHAEIRRMADEAAERNDGKHWWLVSLDEPCDRMFASRRDNLHVTLAAVLYADRIPFHIVDTDREGVACFRTEKPVCVLGVDEGFMKPLMKVLRANQLHGTYKKAGTDKRYRF